MLLTFGVFEGGQAIWCPLPTNIHHRQFLSLPLHPYVISHKKRGTFSPLWDSVALLVVLGMDVYRNSAACGDIPEEFQPERAPSPVKPLWEDFFSEQNKEGDEENMSLQWLSIFVEDCLSSTTCFSSPPPLTLTSTTKTCVTSQILIPHQNPIPTSFEDLSQPAKARRTKRRKTEADANFLNCSADSPLLHQKHWLAESELLIIPKMEKVDKTQVEAEKASGKKRQPKQPPPPMPPPRRCSHCLSQRTPQWRAGPLGPKTLCNACGVRFKSGRLLPEYRPAKSPTFVSYKHSNSHKKVMEMRMSVLTPNSN